MKSGKNGAANGSANGAANGAAGDWVGWSTDESSGRTANGPRRPPARRPLTKRTLMAQNRRRGAGPAAPWNADGPGGSGGPGEAGSPPTRAGREGPPPEPLEPPPAAGTPARVALPVFGLGGCGAGAVEGALLAAGGVLDAYVNPVTELAYITYDPARTNPGELARHIGSAGAQAGAPHTWRTF